jgi:hypothetical protein
VYVQDMSQFCNIKVTPNTHTAFPLCKTVVDKGLLCTRHENHKMMYMFISGEQFTKVNMMFASLYMVACTQPNSTLKRIEFVLR